MVSAQLLSEAVYSITALMKTEQPYETALPHSLCRRCYIMVYSQIFNCQTEVVLSPSPALSALQLFKTNSSTCYPWESSSKFSSFCFLRSFRLIQKKVLASLAYEMVCRKFLKHPVSASLVIDPIGGINSIYLSIHTFSPCPTIKSVNEQTGWWSGIIVSNCFVLFALS